MTPADHDDTTLRTYEETAPRGTAPTLAARPRPGRPLIRAVMVFAERPAEVARWYAAALGLGAVELMPGGAAVVDAGEVELVVHPSDEVKNPPGASTVVYWQTDDLGADLERWVGLGAWLHRGPLVVTDGRSICQLVDPWGNVVGLDGAP